MILDQLAQLATIVNDRAAFTRHRQKAKPKERKRRKTATKPSRKKTEDSQEREKTNQGQEREGEVKHSHAPAREKKKKRHGETPKDRAPCGRRPRGSVPRCGPRPGPSDPWGGEPTCNATNRSANHPTHPTSRVPGTNWMGSGKRPCERVERRRHRATAQRQHRIANNPTNANHMPHPNMPRCVCRPHTTRPRRTPRREARLTWRAHPPGGTAKPWHEAG